MGLDAFDLCIHCGRPLREHRSRLYMLPQSRDTRACPPDGQGPPEMRKLEGIGAYLKRSDAWWGSSGTTFEPAFPKMGEDD